MNRLLALPLARSARPGRDLGSGRRTAYPHARHPTAAAAGLAEQIELVQHPPNIHEAIEAFVLLRQALEILEASAAEQAALYPPERVAAREMTSLFRDAWSRVRAMARAILPVASCVALGAVDEALRAEAVDWDEVRRRARRAGDLLPTPERRHAPRRWEEQLVPGPTHLLHRRQLEEGIPADA